MVSSVTANAQARLFPLRRDVNPPAERIMQSVNQFAKVGRGVAERDRLDALLHAQDGRDALLVAIDADGDALQLGIDVACGSKTR